MVLFGFLIKYQNSGVVIQVVKNSYNLCFLSMDLRSFSLTCIFDATKSKSVYFTVYQQMNINCRCPLAYLVDFN